MRIKLVAAAALAALVLLALPGMAVAKDLAVKNSHGKVVGTWRSDLGSKSGAYNAAGKMVGYCAYDGYPPEVNVFRGHDQTHPGTPIATGSGRKLYDVHGNLIGRALKQSGHWRVDKRAAGKWRKRGTVETPCDALLALSAMRLLNW